MTAQEAVVIGAQCLTNGTLNVPKRTKPGDIIIFAAGVANGSISTPKGGSLFRRLVYRDVLTNEYQGIWWKRAGPDEPESYDYSISGSQGEALAVLRPTVQVRDPFIVASDTGTPTWTLPTAPAAKGSLWFGIWLAGSGTGLRFDAGPPYQVCYSPNDPTHVAVGVADRAEVVGGQTPDYLDVSASSRACYLLVFPPAARGVDAMVRA